MSAGRATRKHHKRSEIDFWIVSLVLSVRTQQINQLRHDLELEFPRLIAERTARHAIERQHRAAVRPENLFVVPSTQSKHLRARSLDDFVEVEMNGIVGHSTAQRIANVLIRDFYLEGELGKLPRSPLEEAKACKRSFSFCSERTSSFVGSGSGKISTSQ